jgi:hypothetical protein
MMAPYVCAKQDDWDAILPYAVHAYRTNRHAVTKVTPFAAMVGHEARTVDSVACGPLENVDEEERQKRRKTARELAIQHTQHAQEKREQRVNRHRLDDIFEVGQMVRQRVHAARRTADIGDGGEKPVTAKLSIKWRGPFVIESKRGHQVTLKRPWREQLKRIANITDLEPWFTDERFNEARNFGPFSDKQEGNDDVVDEQDYIVSQIVDHKDANGQRLYLVSWEGYEDVRYNEWIPRGNFGRNNSLLFEYEQGLLRTQASDADQTVLDVRRALDIGEMVVDRERPDAADEAQASGVASTPASPTAQPKREKANSSRQKATRVRGREDWASTPPRTRSRSGAATSTTRFDRASGGAIVDKRRKQ